MAQNISLWGASYSDVPAINLPKTGGGTAVFTDTSDANAAAGDILSGKSGYVNGQKINGSISSKAAATYNTSTNDQTISAGQYLSGVQTIRKVTTSNISAENIKKGVVVKVGDAGSAGRIKDVTGTYDPVAALFPVGKLWATEDSTENPATVLGFGTWELIDSHNVTTWDSFSGNTWNELASKTWDELNKIVYLWKRTA